MCISVNDVRFSGTSLMQAHVSSNGLSLLFRITGYSSRQSKYEAVYVKLRERDRISSYIW